MVYDILWGSEVVGHARVIRRGCYYEICCRDKMRNYHKIEVLCGNKQMDLGICVPIGNEFGFNAHIPIKRVGEGSFIFRLLPMSEKARVIPVKAGEPFLYISQLKDAYLCRQDGALCVIIQSR